MSEFIERACMLFVLQINQQKVLIEEATQEKQLHELAMLEEAEAADTSDANYPLTEHQDSHASLANGNRDPNASLTAMAALPKAKLSIFMKKGLCV